MKNFDLWNVMNSTSHWSNQNMCHFPGNIRSSARYMVHYQVSVDIYCNREGKFYLNTITHNQCLCGYVLFGLKSDPSINMMRKEQNQNLSNFHFSMFWCFCVHWKCTSTDYHYSPLQHNGRTAVQADFMLYCISDVTLCPQVYLPL